MDEAQNGGMAYCRIFNCARVHEGIIDFYDFTPIQLNTIINYNRFINNTTKIINIKTNFGVIGILKLWQLIKLENEIFTIKTVKEINMIEKTINEIDVMKF